MDKFLKFLVLQGHEWHILDKQNSGDHFDGAFANQK